MMLSLWYTNHTQGEISYAHENIMAKAHGNPTKSTYKN
jgi:hypothetical protein